MIVISSSLVLPTAVAGDAPNDNNPVVGWRNLATVANLSADTETLAAPAANLANPSTYLRWLAADTSEQHITVAHNTVDEIDYVGIAGHNFGSAQIPVSIQGDDGGGFTELVAPIMLPDDAPAIFRFVPTSLEAVRVRLQSGDAPPSAAVVYVGRLLVLQRRIYVGHKPMPFAERVEHSIGRSDRGQYLGSIVLSAWTEGQLAQANVTPEFYRASVEPWRRQGIRLRRPFFFAWRPGDYPLETAYCWPSGDMDVSNQLPNGMMQLSLAMQGISA
jgi:hypothetical protein